MKFKIHKKSKKYLIFILVLLIIFSGLQLLLQMLAPKKILEEKSQYEAVCQPKVSYQVFINPNEVYPGTVQAEDEFYSKKLLNHIQADFEVNFIGSREVPLDIEYQYFATVNGFRGKDEGEALYWTKIFSLSKKNEIKEDNVSTWSKKESVSFPLGVYDAFSVRAKEITGMDVSSELIVSMKGKVIAHTEEKDLEMPFDVSVQIPLMEGVFKITKSGIDPIKDKVVVKVKVPRPIDYLHIIPFAVLLILSLLALIFLLFFSRSPNPQESLYLKVSSIIKNYGSRIVALQTAPKTDCRQQYSVHSMKDLIKIADEIQKPIFYVTDQNDTIIKHEFFVIENDTYYSLSFISPEA
jgi:NADH:ubiquinone oxidoreductase subunit 3 (subunit A)